MKYFIDTEFIEGTQTKRVLSILIGKTKPIIDLISIGIVAEDGREYYAISKDFNLYEAWNRYDVKEIEHTTYSVRFGYSTRTKPEKVYWIRDNVLKPIWEELVAKEFKVDFLAELENPFTYKGLKYLINKYGKTNKQIAEEIIDLTLNGIGQKAIIHGDTKFYGYYADYDWVVFCWLFGRMIDLPNGFPMYCIDLKQTLDNKVNSKVEENGGQDFKRFYTLEDIKTRPDYPKQTNEHNALADARWNKQLHDFLNTI